ncbi:MAG: type I-U CRISPR-associated protein Csb2 [Terricaulis sp.]
MPALLLSIRFHDGRYHGRPEWPPSPARLFQALVAGAARGAALAEEDKRALAWLEALKDAPVIAAPHHREGLGFSNYVPNNDLDAVGGDPARTNEIRAPKLIKPILFNAQTPFLYLWRFEKEPAQHAEAQRVRALADQLYQLGRGIDMAWAIGEILDDAQAEERLAHHEGAIYNPSGGRGGRLLAAPIQGSLDSLIARHRHQRFGRVQSNRKDAQLFRQPPKPLFRQVAYDSPPKLLLFDLIGEQAPATLTSIAALTAQIRDVAARKLADSLNNKSGEIERCFIGHGAEEADKARRVRIVPLPSTGHPHVSPAIRRVLVEIPAACPLRTRDVAWAMSGLELVEAEVDAETGEVKEQLTLAPASDRGMLRHYGIESAKPQRLWRTTTPAALSAARRRIAPERRQGDAKAGAERAHEEHNATKSVHQALRQAGVRGAVAEVRMQREPFSAKGARAEAFAYERFNKERLWHTEITFAEPRTGLLLIGDGRYLGLGLMAPHPRTEGVLAFAIESGLTTKAEAHIIASALRRAVLARVQSEIGEGKTLPLYFTGHAEDGGQARSGAHEHLAFVHDAPRRRLLLIAPHVLERRAAWRGEPQHWGRLEKAMIGFTELRAGAAGKLRLARCEIQVESDPLFAPSKIWGSVAPYRAVRHRKLSDAAAALAADVAEECRRLRLAQIEVEISSTRGIKTMGLTGAARLRFSRAVAGPILIGRDRHFGGGLFSSVEGA